MGGAQSHLGQSPSPSLLTTCPNSRKSPANSRGCWGGVWASKASRGEQEPFINCGKSLPGALDSEKSPCWLFDAVEKGGKGREGQQQHRELLVGSFCLVCTPNNPWEAAKRERWDSAFLAPFHLSVCFHVCHTINRKLFGSAKLLLIAFSPFFVLNEDFTTAEEAQVATGVISAGIAISFQGDPSSRGLTFQESR